MFIQREVSVPGIILAGQPTLRGHSWRLSDAPTASVGAGRKITLWNEGQQMFLAVSDYGLFEEGHTSANEENSQWYVYFTFFSRYNLTVKKMTVHSFN
jgi:hypothetical protein